jgi:hypothetical protein
MFPKDPCVKVLVSIQVLLGGGGVLEEGLPVTGSVPWRGWWDPGPLPLSLLPGHHEMNSLLHLCYCHGVLSCNRPKRNRVKPPWTETFHTTNLLSLEAGYFRHLLQ